MFGTGYQTFNRAVRLTEEWIPEKAYRHESRFQKDLAEFLEAELNRSGLMGGGTHIVSRERGRARADIVVDDLVAIELKRDLSNSQTKKLRGQIETYRDEYPYVIACACGIKDIGGWRELQERYSGGMGFGLGFGTTGGQVAFVHKEKRFFGETRRRDGTGFGGFNPFW